MINRERKDPSFIWPVQTEENYEILSQDSRCPVPCSEYHFPSVSQKLQCLSCLVQWQYAQVLDTKQYKSKCEGHDMQASRFLCSLS
jgi:hypothetical protein